MNKPNNNLVIGIKQLLQTVGDNPDRKELKKTPERFLNGMIHFLSGYQVDPLTIIDSVIDFADDEMIILKDIPFVSICEHHLLPFSGKIHIGYIPNKRIIGVGKVTKIIEALACRLQLQERLMEEIVKTIQNSILKPKGVIVSIEAQHLCMQVGSCNSNGVIFSTSTCSSAFKKNARLKEEFFCRVG